jgi:hypothetical protein
MAFNLSMFNGQKQNKKQTKSTFDTSMFEQPKPIEQPAQQPVQQIAQPIDNRLEMKERQLEPRIVKPSFEDENIAVYGSRKTLEQRQQESLPIPQESLLEKAKKFFDPGIRKTETGKTEHLTLPTDIRDTTAKQRLEKIESPKARGFTAGVEQAFDILSPDKQYIKEQVDLSPKAFTLSTSTQKAPEYLEPITKDTDISFGQIGRGLGEVGKIASTYGVANKLTAGTKFGQSLVSKLPQKYQTTASIVLADQIVDNVAQAPENIVNIIDKDTTLAEDAKNILYQNVLDLFINTGIAGAGAYIKSLKAKPQVIEQLAKESPQQLEQVIKANPDIAKELGLEGVTAKDFLKESENIAKEIEIDNYYKQFETDLPKQEIVSQPLKQTDEFTQTIQPLKIDTPELPKPPIDTKTRVLTETPKKLKTPFTDNLERVYQEVVSKNIPFEKMGGEVEKLASNLNRVSGTVEYNVAGKQVDMLGREVGKSVVDIFSDVPKEQKKDLFDYVLNTHNIDRFNQGKPVFGETVDDITSSNIKNQYDINNPQLQAKQKEITNYFKNLMNDWSVKSGLVSEDTAKMLNEMYPNYVPTYRAKDLPKSMISGNQNISQIVKKAKGGEDFILPIDQQMIAMTDRTIKNARKNEVMNTLNDMFEANPDGVSRYIKEVRGGEKEVIGDILDIGKNFDVEPVVKGNEYIVNFYKNGEPKQMVVNRTLYKALQDVQSDQAINKIAQVVKKYATNPFKELITGKNPIFAASNIMRDVPTALTYSTDPLNMSKNVPKAVEEMFRNGENFKLFKALGGTREGLIGAGKEFKVPNLNETSKAFQNAKKANPIKAIGDINNFTETLPRFSEFLNVLEKTGDPALAIYKSAELTTDFSRHGNLTKLVDNFVPYLNPSVQGIDKFFRTAKNEPLKTALKGASVITVPTLILDQINKDDEDYNNLSPRERNLYFQIPYTDENGERKFARVPKSRELGVMFSSLAEWSMRKSRGQEVTGEEILSTIKENFTPVNIESSKIWTPAMKAWRQIQDPDAYETNYWGGLIVPESQRRYSPGEQYDLNSSGIAKALGQQFEVSPYVIDYFLKSYGGIVSQVVQPIGRDRKKSPLTPLTSKFITDPVYKSNTITKFYDTLEEKKKAAQDYNKANNLVTSGKGNIVTPLEAEANKLSKVSKQLSEIRKEQKELQVKKGNEKELRELQKEMIRLAREALKGD